MFLNWDIAARTDFASIGIAGIPAGRMPALIFIICSSLG
jgi:hypothetical protein